MSSCPPSFENWANHPAGVSEILEVSVGAEGNHAHHASLLPFTLQGQTQGVCTEASKGSDGAACLSVATALSLMPWPL